VELPPALVFLLVVGALGSGLLARSTFPARASRPSIRTVSCGAIRTVCSTISSASLGSVEYRSRVCGSSRRKATYSFSLASRNATALSRVAGSSPAPSHALQYGRLAGSSSQLEHGTRASVTMRRCSLFGSFRVTWKRLALAGMGGLLGLRV
jgi:hypothetical protein